MASQGEAVQDVVRHILATKKPHMSDLETVNNRFLKEFKITWIVPVSKGSKVLEVTFDVRDRTSVTGELVPFTMTIVPFKIALFDLVTDESDPRLIKRKTMFQYRVDGDTNTITDPNGVLHLKTPQLPTELTIQILDKATHVAFDALEDIMYGHAEWYTVHEHDVEHDRVIIRYAFPQRINQPQEGKPNIREKLPEDILLNIHNLLRPADQMRFQLALPLHVSESINIDRTTLNQYIVLVMILLRRLRRPIDDYMTKIDMFFGQDPTNTIRIKMHYHYIHRYWDLFGKQYDEAEHDYTHDFIYTLHEKNVEFTAKNQSESNLSDVVQPILILLNGKANRLLLRIFKSLDTTTSSKMHIGSVHFSGITPTYYVNDQLVLIEEATSIPQGGKAKAQKKKKTAEKVTHNGRTYIVYLGPRNGRYIKVKGVFKQIRA